MSQKRKDSSGRILKKGETQRSNKTYMYRWTDNSGNRNCLYANTLDELREKESQITKEISVGVSRKNITLNEQIAIYLLTKNKLANSTLENYKYYYEHCIKESKLGRMKISDIRKSDILLFYHEYSAKGFSAGTVKILQKIIRPALQLACDDNLIVKNPANGCTKEYVEEMEKKYALTLEEEQEFLERVKIRSRMKRYYPMYAILLCTGLRISEAIGLTWNDVNMDERTIDINHQVQYRVVNGTNQYYANKTKTSAGKRIIPMSEELYQLFLEQRKVWLQTKKDNSFDVDGYRDFVFVSHMTGRCMSHNSIRRMMRNIVDMNEEREIKLPDISPHILRHTRCCRLAESGCDIKVLQYLMGQTDIRVTMQTYNHVDIGRVKREMDRLNAVSGVHQIVHQIVHQNTPNLTPICTPNCREVM